jgi:hypothetical protein
LYTAAELIQALQRRLQLKSPHSRRPPGEFPPGWQAWFDAMSTRVGRVTGATAQAIVALFLARPLAQRPRRSGELTRWQAFATLWRQEWQPPTAEDRRTHVLATTITLLWHLLFGIFLLWLMTSMVEFDPEAERRRGEDVVQVEFVGTGTPEEVGGGQVPQVREETTPSQAAQAAPAGEAAPQVPTPTVQAPAPPEPAMAAPVAQVEPQEIPEPTPAPPAPAEQRVEVSAPTPEVADFVLQAPTPPQVAPREVVVREVQAPQTTIEVTEVPAPVSMATRELPQREVDARPVQSRVPEVAVREIQGPLQRPRPVEIGAPSVPEPTIRGRETSVRAREVPAPSAAPPAPVPASGTSQATAASTSPGQAASQAPAAASASPSPAGTAPSGSSAASTAAPAGARPSAAAPGQGPRPVSAPGSFPTPARSDDWGASSRNVPGGQQGEPTGRYDTTGGPGLAESPINPGQPPGTLDDRIVDLDRSGTWLKRKPIGYEPTTLDKYWRPHETLLQEWVRRGIKRMAIPIPGTGKSIECVVSILQLGGGCGIDDPNLNDQPARARPPPAVPFKPHLQEDNGSVKPPPGG